MATVAAGAQTEHVATDGHGPDGLVDRDPGVLHSESFAKYAVVFLSGYFQARTLHLDLSQRGSKPGQRHLVYADGLVARAFELTFVAELDPAPQGLMGHLQDLGGHGDVLPTLDQSHSLELELQGVFASPIQDAFCFAFVRHFRFLIC